MCLHFLLSASFIVWTSSFVEEVESVATDTTTGVIPTLKQCTGLFFGRPFFFTAGCSRSNTFACRLVHPTRLCKQSPRLCAGVVPVSYAVQHVALQTLTELLHNLPSGSASDQRFYASTAADLISHQSSSTERRLNNSRTVFDLFTEKVPLFKSWEPRIDQKKF